MAQRAKITASNLVPSLIRTYVPVGVGAVVSWLAVKGFSVDPNMQVAVTAILTAVLTSLYFTGVRMLEVKFPAMSILLGTRKQPVAFHKPVQQEGDLPPIPPGAQF